MITFVKRFIYLPIIFIWSSCSQPLQTKVFPHTAPKFKYPEQEVLTHKKNVGIAFSGGGNRSASLTVGQLRALHKLGMLEEVKYISAVSGGAWAAICYTFCPDSIADEELLGSYRGPETLKGGQEFNSPNGIILNSVSNSKVLKRYLRFTARLRGDKLFSSILNDIYLAPLGIDANTYVAYNKTYANDIVNRNKGQLSLNQFVFPNSTGNRPFLIVNGTVVGGKRVTAGVSSMHLEMNAMYSGVSYYNIRKQLQIGGGYVETFALDKKVKSPGKDLTTVYSGKDRHVFSLSDMMAITGNAPGTNIYKNPVLLLGRNIGLPEIRMWPIYSGFLPEDVKPKVKSTEFPMADGGNLENLGLIPLLKRKVDTILVFVNCKTSIKQLSTGEITIDGAITRAFGLPVESPYAISTNLLNNENGEYDTLKKVLWDKKKKGEPLIFSSKYQVNHNPFYGIYNLKHTQEVYITWVYNDGFERLYADALGDPLLQNAYFSGGFDSWNMKFPHLNTFLTSTTLKGIDYEVIWANMLANFSSWVVLDNRNYLKQHFYTKTNKR